MATNRIISSHDRCASTPPIKGEEDDASQLQSQQQTSKYSLSGGSTGSAYPGAPQSSSAIGRSTHTPISGLGGPPTNFPRQTTAAGFPAIPRFNYSNGRAACMTVTEVQRYKAAPRQTSHLRPPPSLAGADLNTHTSTHTPIPAPPSIPNRTRGPPPPSPPAPSTTDAESREIHRLRDEHATPWTGIAGALNAARAARQEPAAFTPEAVYARWVTVAPHDGGIATDDRPALMMVEGQGVSPLAPRSTTAPPTIAAVRKAREAREAGVVGGPSGVMAARASVHWSARDDQELVRAYQACVAGMWEEVAERVGRSMGRTVSGEQCKQRYEAL